MTGSPQVVIAGAGMTAFTRAGRGVRALAEEAVAAALADAGARPDQIQFVAFANAVGGLITGQEMVRAQAALRHTGLLGATIVSVEAACASGAAALHTALAAVRSGAAEVALAVGAERLTSADKSVTFTAIGSAMDLAEDGGLAGRAAEQGRSGFVDVYASLAADYLGRTGGTPADLAQVVVKNRRHAAANPDAQLRDPISAEQVLAARMVRDPLTVPMCAPIGDGAAAVVVASEAAASRLGLARLAVLRSCVLLSGRGDEPGPSVVERATARAFAEAGADPGDVDVAEVHDGAAPGELISIEQLGLTAPGGALGWVRDGTSSLGGRCPVNPSGGLLCRGHPIGATGAAQVVELARQLAGRGGVRQVPGARLAVAESAGGWIGADSAAAAVTVLSR
ncbi:MAG: thiolase family protein [Streptosporangiaceae bacterium]